MKELKYLNKYFVKYKYRFLFGILITIVAQIFMLFTPKLISQSFKAIEESMKSNSTMDKTAIASELPL
jgi:ATP-binding cassette subfamily B protein